MKFQIKGKIETIEKVGQKLMHIVTVAAPDLYSKPSQYKLFSEEQLGTAGQEITCNIEMNSSCYKKNYLKDGIKQHFWEDRVFLNATLAPANAGNLKSTG